MLGQTIIKNQEILEGIHKYCLKLKKSYQHNGSQINEGSLDFAYNYKSKKWGRAYILSIKKRALKYSLFLIVYYVDYGNFAIINIEDWLPYLLMEDILSNTLYKEMTEYPIHIIPASLSNIKPKDECWLPQVINGFVDIVKLNPMFWVSLDSHSSFTPAQVTLYCTTTLANDVVVNKKHVPLPSKGPSVAQMLIDQGLALESTGDQADTTTIYDSSWPSTVCRNFGSQDQPEASSLEKLQNFVPTPIFIWRKISKNAFTQPDPVSKRRNKVRNLKVNEKKVALFDDTSANAQNVETLTNGQPRTEVRRYDKATLIGLRNVKVHLAWSLINDLEALAQRYPYFAKIYKSPTPTLPNAIFRTENGTSHPIPKSRSSVQHPPSKKNSGGKRRSGIVKITYTASQLMGLRSTLTADNIDALISTRVMQGLGRYSLLKSIYTTRGIEPYPSHAGQGRGHVVARNEESTPKDVKKKKQTLTHPSSIVNASPAIVKALQAGADFRQRTVSTGSLAKLVCPPKTAIGVPSKGILAIPANKPVVPVKPKGLFRTYPPGITRILEMSRDHDQPTASDIYRPKPVITTPEPANRENLSDGRDDANTGKPCGWNFLKSFSLLLGNQSPSRPSSSITPVVDTLSSKTTKTSTIISNGPPVSVVDSCRPKTTETNVNHSIVSMTTVPALMIQHKAEQTSREPNIQVHRATGGKNIPIEAVVLPLKDEKKKKNSGKDRNKYRHLAGTPKDGQSPTNNSTPAKDGLPPPPTTTAPKSGLFDLTPLKDAISFSAQPAPTITKSSLPRGSNPKSMKKIDIGEIFKLSPTHSTNGPCLNGLSALSDLSAVLQNPRPERGLKTVSLFSIMNSASSDDGSSPISPYSTALSSISNLLFREVPHNRPLVEYEVNSPYESQDLTPCNSRTCSSIQNGSDPPTQPLRRYRHDSDSSPSSHAQNYFSGRENGWHQHHQAPYPLPPTFKGFYSPTPPPLLSYDHAHETLPQFSQPRPWIGDYSFINNRQVPNGQQQVQGYPKSWLGLAELDRGDGDRGSRDKSR